MVKKERKEISKTKPSKTAEDYEINSNDILFDQPKHEKFLKNPLTARGLQSERNNDKTATTILKKQDPFRR